MPHSVHINIVVTLDYDGKIESVKNNTTVPDEDVAIVIGKLASYFDMQSRKSATKKEG